MSDARSPTSPAPPETENRRFAIARLFPTAAFAALVFVVADGLLAITGTGPAPAGAADLACVVAGALGHVALATVGAGLVAAIVLAIGRFGSRRVDPALWASFLLLAGLFVLVNRTTFDGPAIRAHDHFGLIVVGFHIGGIFVIGTGLLVIRTVWRRAPRLLAATFAFVAGAVGIAALTINARVLVGLYPSFHHQLAAVGLLLPAIGFAMLRRDAPAPRGRTLAVVVTLAVVATGLGLVARHTTPWPRAAAVLGERLRGVAVVAELTEPIFRRLGPAETPLTADHAALDELMDVARTDEARARLDAMLPDRKGMHLVIFSIDTMRADAAGFLGRDPSPTPCLDAFARESVVFERAYTCYPTSKFAYSSLLTGLYPRITPAADPEEELGLDFPEGTTLGGLLMTRGYTTAGVTAFNQSTANNPLYFGTLRDGFGTYTPGQKIINLTGDEVVDRCATLIDDKLGDRDSFFLWGQILEPHAPYEGPPFAGATGLFADYLGDVARADAIFGRLVAKLKTAGLWDRTVVVVHSDHGEEFREHGSPAHNSNLYEPQTHVPLLIRVPGLAPRRVSDVVGLVDVFPTVCDLLAIDDRLPRSGRSLVADMLGTPAPRGGFAFAERLEGRGHAWAPSHEALWAGTLKLIRRPATGAYELYDLATDRAEMKNLLGEDPARDRRMKGVMAALLERSHAHHGQSTVAVSDPAAFRDRTRELVDAALAGTGERPLIELQRHLFDGYGGVLDVALRAHGREGIVATLDELTRSFAKLDPGNRRHLTTMYLRTPDWPELVPGLKAAYAAASQLRPQLAMALALLGDDTGKADLRAVIATPNPKPGVIAAALACVGDTLLVNWYYHNLRTPGDWETFHATLRAFPHLPDLKWPLLGRRMWLHAAPPRSIALRLATLAGGDRATGYGEEVLLRLLNHPAPDVRARVEQELALADAATLEAERQATAFELEGDLAIRHYRYDNAVARYQRALALTSRRRPALRFRAAHVMRLDGKTDEARALLAGLATDPPCAADTALPGRMTETLDEPVLLTPETFGAKVDVQFFPKRLLPGNATVVRVAITNTGKLTWSGGILPQACALRIGFLDVDGRIEATESSTLNWLPDEGIRPGETRIVEVVGKVPWRQGPFRAVLLFAQEQSRLPDSGILHRF